MKTLIYIIALVLAFSSCSSSEDSSELMKEYPKVDAYIQQLDLETYSSVEKNKESFDSYTFHGYQEPENKCHFFDVTLDVGETTITTLTFKNKEAKRLYSFVVYEFKSNEDLAKFKDFIPDASLYLNKNKEIHEYFPQQDKVIMYHFGFP